MKFTIRRLLFLVFVVAAFLAVDQRVESRAKDFIRKIEIRDNALRVSEAEFHYSVRAVNVVLRYETTLTDRFCFRRRLYSYRNFSPLNDEPEGQEYIVVSLLGLHHVMVDGTIAELNEADYEF